MLSSRARRLAEPILGTFRCTRVGQRLLYAWRYRSDPVFAALLKDGSREQRFAYVYAEAKWGSAESRSGPGSDLQATGNLRGQFARLLEQERVRSIFDAGCGDFNWMQEVPFAGEYLGGDIVADLIHDLNAQFGSERRRFMLFDAVDAVPPAVDLILCREVLIHLPNADVWSALSNFKKSGSRLLLITTNRERSRNFDIEAGGHRDLNLECAPFRFPPAKQYLTDEAITSGRQMALYDLTSLAV